jgi:hypothetical protein
MQSVLAIINEYHAFFATIRFVQDANAAAKTLHVRTARA